MMRVLVGCECSGVVRNAFRALGHDAWSCDLKPAEDASPFHIQDDVLNWLHAGWDLAVFHPVCRYLTNSGAKHLYLGGRKENGPDPDRWEKMQAGADFYLKLWDAPIERVAVENPIWHEHAARYIQTHARRPHPKRRQFVQPWWFGHLEVKATGLALRELPPLRPTHDVRAETFALSYAERAKVHYASPGPNREADRSRTLPGLGRAMAFRWAGPVGVPLEHLEMFG